jgi:hypothetical protein
MKHNSATKINLSIYYGGKFAKMEVVWENGTPSEEEVIEDFKKFFFVNIISMEPINSN